MDRRNFLFFSGALILMSRTPTILAETMGKNEKLDLTEEEWRQRLTADEF